MLLRFVSLLLSHIGIQLNEVTSIGYETVFLN